VTLFKFEIKTFSSKNNGKTYYRLQQQLQKYFGFTSFLKVQEDVIRKVLERQSAAAIFPTGAGTSPCYQSPSMLQSGMTLVVSPLMSLTKDQLDFYWQTTCRSRVWIQPLDEKPIMRFWIKPRTAN
jgi:hypothetical protein